jgi:hypothetical protein
LGQRLVDLSLQELEQVVLVLQPKDLWPHQSHHLLPLVHHHGDHHHECGKELPRQELT